MVLAHFCLLRSSGGSSLGAALPTTLTKPLDEPTRIRQALIRTGGNVVRAALSTAIALYRAMDMTFWLPQAEVALAQAGEAGGARRDGLSIQ